MGEKLLLADAGENAKGVRSPLQKAHASRNADLGTRGLESWESCL